MITREQIHELAQFEDEAACALTFYFQPSTPRNKAHKEEAIVTKDLVREAFRQLEEKSTAGDKPRQEAARADLDRIMRLSQELRGNGTHAKAVFACSAQGFWREYDLPARLSSTELSVGRHFHLKPLAQLLGSLPSLGVVLLDRHRARLFDLRLGEISERLDFFHPLTRRGRSDGFMGFDAGHAERHVEDEVREHFKSVAEVLKTALEKGVFEKWILGCQEIHWPQFEPQLHPYAAQRLLGRFVAEVGYMSNEEIRSQAEKVLAGAQERRCHELVREALEQAGHNNLGVTGLRRVLFSLELGEVQTLLIGQNYRAQAVECSNCGHLDAHLVSSCPVCGHPTREVVDVVEAVLPRVIQNNLEMVFLKDDAELDKVGNIAALLRYRSEQNHNLPVRSVADVPPNPSVSRRSGVVGPYRGLASG
jgi:peptide chain release factor subunit 1